jgi:hypothetical protein
MAYSSETQIYEATGMTSAIVQSLGNCDANAVSNRISNFITQSDKRIKRLLGIPYTIRKEFHTFNEQHT